VRKLLIIIVLISLAVYAATGVTQVQPGERGLVRRFGKFVARVGPGLHIGWPVPIERVDRVALDRVRRLAVGYQPDRDEEIDAPPGQLLTGDHNLINVQVLIDYTLEEDALERYVLQADRVEIFLTRAAESLMAEYAAANSVDDVLLRGKLELPRLLMTSLQARMDVYGLGVSILGSSIAYLYPPSEVKLAFDEVNRAQTAIRTREHEATQAADDRRRKAEAEHTRIETLARAYAIEQNLLANADAARFAQRLAQYVLLSKDNPAFLAGIWWEEMGMLFSKLKQGGRIDFLDNRIGADGLDITIAPPLPGKKGAEGK
jgi:modulator of FtsH protease HflK